MKNMISKGSVHELLAHRERALECAKKGFELLAEAERAYEFAGLKSYGLFSGFTHSDWFSIGAKQKRWDNQNRRDRLIEKVRKNLDRATWDNLLNRSGMTNLMDSETVEDFRNQIEENPPEPSLDVIESTFANLYENRDKTFKRGLVNVFKKLDSKHYRSHSAFRINKRIILNGVVGECGWNYYGSGRERLSDVDRILHLLDGKEPKGRDQDVSAMLGLHIKAQLETKFESDYMDIRVYYGNGNIHIWFKCPELLEKVNGIIAEHYGQTLAKECA